MSDTDTNTRKKPTSRAKLFASSAMGEFVTIQALIAQRLADLTPEQFIAPSDKMSEEHAANALGILNDNQRRLWTLRCQLGNEANDLQRRRDELNAQINDVFDGKDHSEVLKRLATGGLSLDLVEERDRVDADLLIHRHLCKLVQDTFALDVRMTFAGLAGKPCFIVFDDWTMVWYEPPSNPLSMFEVSAEGMPAALQEMLGDVFGAMMSRRRRN